MAAPVDSGGVLGGFEVRQVGDGVGPEVWVERHVAAPIDEVWAVVSDPALPAQFSEELQETEWVEDWDEVALGAQFVGRNARGENQWETTCTVVACEPGQSFTYVVDDVEKPLSVWSWELEEVEGGTAVRHHASLGPGRSGLTWAVKQSPDDWEAITLRRLESLQANMARTLDGIAELLA